MTGAEVGVAGQVVRGAMSLVPAVWRGIRQSYKKRTTTGEALTLLGLDYARGDYDYQVPRRHPFLELGDECHPDDLAAFSTVADPALSYAMSNNLLTEQARCLSDLGQDLVIIGSPESEPLTRLIFGYRRHVEGDGLEYTGGTVDLAYRWNEDRRDVGALCMRYVEGHGLVERPNWPLISVRRHREERLVPRVDRDGMLETDFLLVTVVPNFLTRRALDEGKRIVHIAGSHGVGTRAIGLLVSDDDSLGQIGRKFTNGRSAFQVVAEVGRIKHRTSGSYATRIRLHDAVKLNHAFDSWLASHAVVAARFSDWSMGDYLRNRPLPHERQ